MRNLRVSRITSRMVLALVVVSCMALSAFAQATPTPPDLTTAAGFASLATSGKDGVVTSLSGVTPVAFGLLAILLGVGVAWRMIKKGAKSS